MNVELKPHISKNEDGTPLFPDERSIWYGEQHVGYVGSPPKHPIMFINHWAGDDPDIVAQAKALVEKEFGCEVQKVTNVHRPAEPDAETYDDLEDE